MARIKAILALVAVTLLASGAFETQATQPSPPLSHACDPLSYRYVTQTYHCDADCRTYTLVDVNADCMPNWAGARAYCESHGLELAPWDTDASRGALHKLCRDNRYTCWTGGRDASSGLCPLMTQEGHIVHQGCEQPVRWVCRTKKPTCARPSSPPPRRPRSPSPPPRPPRSPSPPPRPPRRPSHPPRPASSPPRPASPLPRPPSPQPPPVCDPYMARYKRASYYCNNDCRTYTLYDIDAICMVDYRTARKHCEWTGGELVPYGEAPALGALRKLCRDNRYTCWTGGHDASSGLCPLMTQEGHIVHQGCEQPVRWVCRTKEPRCMAP